MNPARNPKNPFLNFKRPPSNPLLGFFLISLSNSLSVLPCSILLPSCASSAALSRSLCNLLRCCFSISVSVLLNALLILVISFVLFAILLTVLPTRLIANSCERAAIAAGFFIPACGETNLYATSFATAIVSPSFYVLPL